MSEPNAPVAQLDRASDFGSEGYRLKSCPGYHLRKYNVNDGFPVDVKRAADALLEEVPDFEHGGGRVTSPQGPLKQLTVEQIAPNIVIFYQKSGNIMKPPGWIMVYFLDTEQAAADMKVAKIDYPLFIPGSMTQRASGYDMLNALWKKRKAPQNEAPQEQHAREAMRHVVGALEAYRRDKEIFVDYISVRPGWRKNTIGTKMMQAMEKEFPGLPINHSPTTDAGYKFMKKTGYLRHDKSSWGGQRHGEKTAESIVKAVLEDEDEWIGVDLDGTLAKHNHGKYRPTKIGDPIPKMVARVRRWVGHGKKVKIFTARADDEIAVNAIKKWLKDNELPDLEITNLKDKGMSEFWDDKAVGVEKNTGEVKEDLADPYVELLNEALDQLMEMWKVADDSVADYTLQIETAVNFIQKALRTQDRLDIFQAMEKAKGALEREYDETGEDEDYNSLVNRLKAALGESLGEAVVGDDPDVLAQIEFILNELAGIEDIDEFIETANQQLTHFKIKFTYDDPATGQDLHSPMVHYGGWMYLPLGYNVFNTIQTAKNVIAHEYVHQRQHQRADARGSGDAMIASTDRLIYKGGKIDTEGYYGVPQELMAYAKSAVDVARESGLTPQEILRRLRSDSSFPGEYFINRYRRTKDWNRVARYMADYLTGQSESLRQEAVAVVEDLINESPEIKTLKKNQIKLDPEEREQVMKAGAVWHHGPNGEASPAVRKAVVNGKTWYWCATHRAGQVKPTLKGAIKAFDFVKTTA